MKLFDKFVANNSLVQEPMHCLIGISCLILAVKIHENCILNFDQASQLCYIESGIKDYTFEMLATAEFQIAKELNFDLNLPNALDLL